MGTPSIYVFQTVRYPKNMRRACFVDDDVPGTLFFLSLHERRYAWVVNQRIEAEAGMERGDPLRMLELAVGQILSLRGGRRRLVVCIDSIEMRAHGRRAALELRVV